MLQLIKNRNEKFEIFIQNRSPLFRIFKNIAVTYNTLKTDGKISGFFSGIYISLFIFFL